MKFTLFDMCFKLLIIINTNYTLYSILYTVYDDNDKILF